MLMMSLLKLGDGCVDFIMLFFILLYVQKVLVFKALLI